MKHKRRPILLLAALAALAVTLVFVFWLAQQFAISNETRRVEDRISLYRSTLVSALEEHQHLPFILARDPLVLQVAQGADAGSLNQRLETFKSQAGVDAIYLMDQGNRVNEFQAQYCCACDENSQRSPAMGASPRQAYYQGQ